MPLPNLPWSTQYPGNQDTGVNAVDQMPTLQNDSSPGAYDGHRVLVDHVHALRNKLQSVALKVGDDVKVPVGSLVEIVDISSGDASQFRMVKRASAPTHQANKGFIYTREVGGRVELFYKDSNGSEVQLTNVGYLKTPITTKGDLLTRSAFGLDRLGLGLNGQVLTVDNAQTLGIKWAAAGGTDADAIHKSVRQEIHGLTEQGTPNIADVLVLEAYSEVIGTEWSKRKVTVHNLRQETNAAWLQGNLISSASPDPLDTLIWSGSQWQPQSGGSGTLDRMLILSDTSEFSEAGTSWDDKKEFEVVFDSTKPPTAWRFVAEVWCEGGNGTTDTAECRFECGSESFDQVTVTTTETTGGTVLFADLTITSAEPNNIVLDAAIALRVQPGSSGTAHVRYTDCYLIY